MKGFSVTPDNGRAARGSRQAASYVLVINLNKMSVVHSNQLVCTVQLASQCAHGNHNLKLLIEQDVHAQHVCEDLGIITPTLQNVCRCPLYTFGLP